MCWVPGWECTQEEEGNGKQLKLAGGRSVYARKILNQLLEGNQKGGRFPGRGRALDERAKKGSSDCKSFLKSYLLLENVLLYHSLS